MSTQKNVWFLRDDCFYDKFGIFCSPWYNAERVKIVRPMEIIAEVLVKAAFLKAVVDKRG